MSTLSELETRMDQTGDPLASLHRGLDDIENEFPSVTRSMARFSAALDRLARAEAATAVFKSTSELCDCGVDLSELPRERGDIYSNGCEPREYVVCPECERTFESRY